MFVTQLLQHWEIESEHTPNKVLIEEAERKASKQAA